MNLIRKISIGSDYKGSSMHYLIGQPVLNNSYTIHLIEYDVKSDSYLIYIQKLDEVKLWKQFNKNMPVSIEFNIDF
ncbi:MAG: hypothetical protein Tp133SUR523431_37 [Prokaryotic dsDNA virus sp.]|nr:MAG: hypothetical protein Tp133SUR523431_37 [Prokaryotic dsDNA virus sp.]|tara:strand:+ start:3254 stop:3481 length:228 start_codon:yes stop_codon:yes gene_type:complete